MNESDQYFIELENSKLENTEFYKLYSGLDFNGGVIFKRVSPIHKTIFTQQIKSLGFNENKQFDSSEKASSQAHDFIYEFLTNQSILDMGWRFADDEVFTFLEEEFNSVEKFRRFLLQEISVQSLEKEILTLAQSGGVYARIKKSEEELKSIVNEFFNLLKSTGLISKILIAYWPWGYDNGLSLFQCIFILFEDEILIFAKDDYD